MRVWILALALGGCGIADFDVDQPVPEQTIAGSALPGPLASLFPLPLNLDISQQIKAHDTGPIDSVTMSSLDLTITATARPQGDTDDWSFVDSVDVFIESTKSGTALPKVKIATVSRPAVDQPEAVHRRGNQSRHDGHGHGAARRRLVRRQERVPRAPALNFRLPRDARVCRGRSRFGRGAMMRACGRRSSRRCSSVRARSIPG